MTEDEAIAALDVPHGTIERIEAFVAFLAEESERQNLVSRSSLEAVWERHILDSAQLLRFAPTESATWVDLGTGAGFPGLVVAALSPARFTLVEARRLRADFLLRSAEILGIEDRVEVLLSKVEAVPVRPFDVISAALLLPWTNCCASVRPYPRLRQSGSCPRGEMRSRNWMRPVLRGRVSFVSNRA